jgi:hypothetical protein
MRKQNFLTKSNSMKQLKVVNGFTEMSNERLLVKATLINTSMAGNPAFPTPVPSLTDLAGAIGLFQADVLAAEGGDKLAIAERDQQRDVLVNVLHLLGNYVLFTSAGDEVKAKSSGFGIGKIPAPAPPMTTPTGLELKNGVNKGELKLRFRRVLGARSYRYDITPGPLTQNNVWESSSGTIAKKQFSGLESGKEYYCRVVAIGIKDQEVISDAVSRFAV